MNEASTLTAASSNPAKPDLAAVKALHSESGSTRVELRDGSHAAVGRRVIAELKRRLGIG